MVGFLGYKLRCLGHSLAFSIFSINNGQLPFEATLVTMGRGFNSLYVDEICKSILVFDSDCLLCVMLGCYITSIFRVLNSSSRTLSQTAEKKIFSV